MLCHDIVEKGLTSQQPSASREMEEWKENEFLPKGWREQELKKEKLLVLFGLV